MWRSRCRCRVGFDRRLAGWWCASRGSGYGRRGLLGALGLVVEGLRYFGAHEWIGTLGLEGRPVWWVDGALLERPRSLAFSWADRWWMRRRGRGLRKRSTHVNILPERVPHISGPLSPSRGIRTPNQSHHLDLALPGV